MTDEAKALVDHAGGCEGRTYSCTCGYDDARDELIETQAREIERLKDTVAMLLHLRTPDANGCYTFRLTGDHVRWAKEALGESHDQ